MELPQLVVELVGDYSKLMEDIKRARVEAVKQAQFLEKDLNLTIGVNDDSLKNLNKHFDLKVTHFKQTQTYFKNNPLKVYVDDNALSDLNKELSLLSGGSGNRARVSVDVEVNKEKANLIINNNNNSREIVGQLKSVEKAVIDSAKLSLGQSLGTGITEEFGRTIGKNLMSGFKKNLGLDVAGATQSFTRAVSKPLSKVNPESVQKFEDDIVSALEEAFVFKNQSQAEEKFKAAFQPIVSEIQEIAYAAAGQVLKVGAQPLRIRKRVLLAQSAQEAAKMSESVNVPDNEDIKKAKSISLITGGIDFQEGGLNTFFAENLVKRVLPGSYSVPVTNPYSNDKNNLGQIYQFRSNLSNGQMVVGADGVERPASEPMPLDMLLHTNLEKGYNPDSVKMAAEAIAYRKKYPDKPIQLAGTSGGSYVVEEAIAILERAGITNVKGLGLTAPVNNLMTTASQANYRSLVGEFDPLNVAMFGGKNVTDKEHPVYKATLKEMPFGMPGLMEESPLMSLIPGAGKGHALLPFLTKPMVNEQIQSFLGDAIDPVSSSLSKGMKSEPNLHFFKSQLDEKDSLVRTFKAVLGDGSTLRQIEKAGFNGAEGYTFAVPQKPGWRREHDFSSMMGNLPNARQIGKDVKPEFDEYTAFLEEMRAGIVEFLDSGAKSKQSLAKTLEKAIKFYPELRILQTRVLETLEEQARLTDLNKNPKKDTRTAREKYTDNQRLARINAQFPQGQEYLKDFKTREKDADLSPEARAGLESARNIAAQFNKSFATLQTLTKSGNLDEAANMAAAIKQMGVKAREEIKLITKSLGENNTVGSTRLGSQLGQTLSQVSSVQKKTDRVISVNKLTLPNTVSVGENTIDGMRQGIEKELEKLKTTAEKIPNTVTDVVTEKLQMESPSKVMMGYGKNTGGGLSVGIDNSLKNVKSSSEKLASTVINAVEEKLEIKSPSRWGIRTGKYVGEGFVKGLEFLEGSGVLGIFIKVINDIKNTVENGDITSSTENFKNKLSRGFSKGLGSIPGFKEAKERFKGYRDFLKEVANPNISLALGESLANGIVAAKELFVDFLKMPTKIKEGFEQAKVAFNSFVEGMNKVQKFGEIMDFLKSSIGNVVKVLALLAVGKIILDLAPASIEVAANFENLERRIKFTSGSISEGAKNIAFLRSEAKRLNVDLSQTLESGSKFFQATKDTPLEGFQSRQIVSAVTQASAVYGLDLDKQQRTFTALEQMSGKTVVSQEELRQQLAEAIPNASQIAANAYGTTTQSMNQLLSTGRVLAEDFLPKFAQQLKAQTSSGVGNAVNSSVAITNRFNNSLIELQESIGKTLLPFRNFSLSVFASGIDLVTKNFQLLQSILLITLIKLGSPIWMMFAAYLKEISFSGNLAKGALLGMGQSIATLAKQMFVLSMAMNAIDEIMMNFKDNSGAIGEQTRNVTQSINEQRKLLSPSSKTSSDDFSAFRERFTLNPFDNDTKKLKKQMEDSAKQATIGQQNTFDILKDSKSPAIQDAIQEIQAIDKALDNIKMKRRAVIANDPGDIQTLRELQNQEKELSQRREKPLELFGGNKANLDKQVETLKTYLEYWEELKKNPKLYQSEIDDINKIIKVTKEDLATVTAEQDKMTKAIKNSLTEMQKFAIEIRDVEARFNDLRSARDKTLNLRKINLFNSASNGGIQPGQVEYTNNLTTQADLINKISDNLKQIQEMSAQLNTNGLDDVLSSQNLNRNSGTDAIRSAQERAIDGTKEKEILTNYVKVREMQTQTIDMQVQLSEQKNNLTQSLYQQTKQVADYYRAAVRESKAVGIEFKKAQKTLENSKVQNKLREALIGAGDNIYTQFVEGIINLISQTSDIQKQQLESKKQRIDYDNNVQDIKLQAAELQRSLPGKIIPLDSGVADKFDLSLKNVNNTVNEINKNIKDVANGLSKDVVDAAKKADAELDKLNQSIKDLDSSSNSWIEGFGSKFARLVNVFENGFDGIGSKITDLQLQTASWLGSLGNAPTMLGSAINVVEGAKSAVTGIFGKEAGQQLEQNVKSAGAISNLLGANKNGILSPIQGTTVEDLLRYKPSYRQGFYGIRDKGARQHSKVDFDSRAKAGQNAKIIASLPGTATARKWTGNSGVVFVNSVLSSGQKLTLEYGHLSLESIKKAFGGQLGKSIEVQAGQKLGNVIHDALSSGPHLDFGVRLNGKYIDPQKFLQDFVGGKYGGVVANGAKQSPATSSEIQELQNAVNNFSQTKQKQREYKDERNPWQRFTNWLMPSAGASEMPQQKTNTGVNFRKTSDAYKLNIDPKKTRLEFSKGWDQESKAYRDNNALGYFTAPMFNSWIGTERGKVVPVADLKFQDSVFRTKNRSAAKQRAFVNIDKQGKTRFGYGELTQDLEKQSDIFIGGLHVLYNNTEKQPAGYKGAYNTPGKQSAVSKTSRIRLIYGLNKDGSLSIVQSRKNLSIDEAKKLALKNGFNAAYLPDHGSKSRVIVPGVQAFDSTMRGEVGGYDSPTPYLIKVTSKPAVKPTAKPKVTSKPAENAFVSEPEPEKSGWDKLTNNTKKLVSNFSSQLPEFKLPEFKLPNLDVPSFDLMGNAYPKPIPIASRKPQVSPIDPRKLGLPSIQGDSFSENAQNLINTQLKPKPNQATFHKNPNPRPIPVTSKPVAVKPTPTLAKPNQATLQKNPNLRSSKPVAVKPQPQPTGNWMKTIASTYGEGDGFHGKKTSSGEIFNKNAMTAAMNQDLKKKLGVKWGDKVEAVNEKNSKSVIVRITDHGPYEKKNGKFVPHSSRGLDLSTAAANKIGVSLGEVKFRLLGKNSQALDSAVLQGKPVDPNSQQKLVTQATKLKLNTAAQQYEINRTNSNLSPEQIKENELKQRLEAYRFIMSSQKTALGDISSTKDSTLGTRRTVLDGLSPNMSNAGRFSLQFNDLRRKLEKDVESLEQIIRETDGAIAQKPDLQAAFNLAMKKFPNDPKLAAEALQTNDLSFKATAFKNAEAKNNLAFLKSNINSILKASLEDFDKKEFFRLSEQDIQQQTKVIEQLQQQLQLVQKLKEIDPLNPLVLNIPSLQRNISLLELNRDQYQQLLDLRKRYYEGGGKGGNMSEEAFQKEFKAILGVNSVKKEGVALNFNYADTVERIRYATDELTKAQTIQSSSIKLLQLDNERFAIDNKDGMVSLVSLTNELTIKTNELTNAYKKQLLEIQGNTLLSPQEKLTERLKAFRNYGKEKSNLDAENSYQTKLAPITNRGIELGRMEKLISSENAVSSEVMRGQGLFGIRNKELQKAQVLSQIKMDFEREKMEIEKFSLSMSLAAEDTQKLTNNLNKLNELKLDNVAKEFNMFTEAISGVKGDFDNILKGFIMNDSVSKNAGDLQGINKSLDDIAKKRRDIIMNTSGNIQEVKNAYQNPGNNERLKELDRAQRDLEKKKTELSRRNIADAFIEIGKSILSNLASVASKELSNQLFGKLTEFIFGKKNETGAAALNTAGSNLNTSALMLQEAALALRNGGGAGDVGSGVMGGLGEGLFGILEGSSATPFASSGEFDFSSGFDLGGGLDFGSATLPSFAKGGMVGDLLNKERAMSGFNPHLIIANEGERVLTPKETKIWNQLNSSNNLESFSSGGMVGQGLGNINNVGRSGDTINITPNVNINNEGGGNINKALFEKALEAKIQETIKQERRPGGSLNRGGLYDR